MLVQVLFVVVGGPLVEQGFELLLDNVWRGNDEDALVVGNHGEGAAGVNHHDLDLREAV